MIKDTAKLLEDKLKLLSGYKWQIESMNRNINIQIPESVKLNQAFGFLVDALAQEVEVLENIINKLGDKSVQ